MGKGGGSCTERPATEITAATGDSEVSQSATERGIQIYGSKVDAIIARAVGHKIKRPKNAKEMMNGEQVFQREVDKRPVLPYAIQRELCIIAQDEEESDRERLLAKQAMVWHNQKWVIGQAYSSYWKGRGATPQELIQVGNEGLMLAVEQFDPEMGNTFITYAKNKIFMKMQRHTENSSADVHGVRVPTDRYNEIHVTVKKAVVDLSESLQRDPTIEELLPVVNQDRPHGKRLTQERVEDALHLLKSRPTSMQSRLRSDDGDDLEFGATLISEKAGPVQETSNQELGTLIHRAFETLDEREKLVVGTYLGIGEYQQVKSLNQIAEKNGMKQAAAARLFKEGQAKMIATFAELGYDKDMLLEK